jgi:uncharacterized protein YndB with AHSA1/START domain
LSRLRIGAEIDAPLDVVWDLLTDTQRWPEWGPSIRSVQSAERHIRSGSTGRVQTVVGVRLPYQVTEIDPGRSWDWRVAGLPSTGHEVDSIALDKCRVVFTVPWLLAPYAIVVKLALRRLATAASSASGIAPAP